MARESCVSQHWLVGFEGELKGRLMIEESSWNGKVDDAEYSHEM